MSILLDSHIYGLAIELERVHEAARNVVLLFGLLQVCKQLLQLVKQVVFKDVSVCGIPERNIQNLVAQVRNHVQMLEQGIHVACAPKVLETHEAAGLSETHIGIKLVEVDEPPGFLNLGMELAKDVETLPKVALIVGAQSQKQGQASRSRVPS